MANTQHFPCGIVLPKDTGKPASLFFIRGKAPHYDGMGPVVNAIIKAGEGSFDFPTGRRGDDRLRALLAPMPCGSASCCARHGFTCRDRPRSRVGPCAAPASPSTCCCPCCWS